MPLRSFVTFLFLVLAWLGPAGPAATQSPLEVRIERDSQSRFLTTGVWGAQGLVFLDALRNRLTRLVPGHGTSLEAWRLGEFEDLEPFPHDLQASRIHALPTGDLLVQVRAAAGHSWAVVRLAPSGTWTIQDSWDCTTCSANQWVPLYPGLLLAVGEIQNEDGAWEPGLYWIAREGGPTLAHPLGEEELPAYMMGLTWLTHLGGRAYAIVPEPPETHPSASQRYLEVVELSPQHRGGRRLARLPAPVPDIPYPERDSVGQTFARLTDRPIPLALAGVGDHLVVLLLQGERVGLWTIDVGSGGLHFVEELPAARSATAVAGEASLALIRKGPMEGLGQQSLQGLTLYPIERLNDRTIR